MGSSVFLLPCVLFLLSVFQIITPSSGRSCLHHQSSALLHFKHSFSINKSVSWYSTYPKVESWKPDTDCCYSDGVTCDIANGHVIGLDLSDSWLYGPIHSNTSLFHLHHLQRLSLAFNNFSYSPIPSGFHLLTNLTHLNLSYSRFSGQIPLEISGLTKLVSLDLSTYFRNRLKLEKPSLGTLVQRLTNLRELHLDYVNISAVVPDFLSDFSSMTTLHLSSCQLYGRFPINIFLLPNLQSLRLSGNPNLTVYLPEYHSNNSLRFLDLSTTSISGVLLDSISKLKLLNSLILRGCNFSGSIPSSIGKLTQLTTLDLSDNNFSGQIPSSIGKLTQLISLDLANNQLSGQIPSSVANLTHLKRFSLWNNQLIGPIPSYVTELSNLIVLWLDGNSLSGTIPRSISKLMNLESLFLSSNNFSGTVGLNLFLKLKNLTELFLSYNSFSLITTVHINSTLPKFDSLGLSSCNIREFPEFLRNQKGLSYLDLSNNKIHGQIPKWMWNVGKETMYHINFSHNFLQGLEEPPAILPYDILRNLDLHSNQLQGPLPIPPNSTTFFSAANNILSGEISLLICKASSLEILDLSNNNLSGLIPQCLGDFSNSISVVKLRRNRFHGTIPHKFSNGSLLRTLDINDNQLEGRVPRSLINCKRLEVLDLGNNQLNDTFPFWLESQPELQVLVLRLNNFHGPIGCPRTDCTFSKLHIVDISYNEFTGDLPSTYFLHWSAMMMSGENKSQFKYMGDTYYQDSVTMVIKGVEIVYEKILTIFSTIDFSNNRFQGEIPESIGNLSSLRALNFSSNSFTGCIPSSLGNLTKIESLDLSQNKLSGKIPQQLTSLTFLAVLNLSRNHLMGPIPRGQQFDTFLSTSYEGNSRLCGLPLVKKCAYTDAVQQPTFLFHQDQDLEATSEEFDWKILLMGYGCGMYIHESEIYSLTKALALAQAEQEKEYLKDLLLALLEMEHKEAPADMSTTQALDNAREIHEIKGSITAIFESLKSLTMAQASNHPILQLGPSSVEQPTRSSPNPQPTDDPDFGQYE
ncbi:hypothetical protein HHK36_023460 [Tetracentron sinense]|uniref:Receptor-like protein 12 n=1 Tax=Tetracentron sinense TaxID=13715 RepID=A0A835D8Q4_TETSI|nr:hypothetical protein HHK36_023460 [Tetracentron sinense]